MSKKQKQHQMILPGNPLGVKVVGSSREDLASALKTWKRKVKASDVLETVKDRKEYTKPTVSRRKEKIDAIYMQRIKDLRNI